jgi:hypothetical protein
MTEPPATRTMKALVCSRLMMGDFKDWEHFVSEREFARQIRNRRQARSVTSQIGRDYKKIKEHVRHFISQHFENATEKNLADLCETIPVPYGLHETLLDFENKHFSLSSKVKSKYPIYAHISISYRGLQFEFPEHHFLNDIEVLFLYLQENEKLLSHPQYSSQKRIENNQNIKLIVSKEKFLSRALISTAFSLVETTLSGIFFTAAAGGTLGQLTVDKDFRAFAIKKESAPLKQRLSTTVQWATQNYCTGDEEPFKSFMSSAKKFRDSIHHPTPFGRQNNLEEWERLELLYEIDAFVALNIIRSAFAVILTIFCEAFPDSQESDVRDRLAQLDIEADRILNGVSLRIYGP